MIIGAHKQKYAGCTLKLSGDYTPTAISTVKSRRAPNSSLYLTLLHPFPTPDSTDPFEVTVPQKWDQMGMLLYLPTVTSLYLYDVPRVACSSSLYRKLYINEKDYITTATE